MKLLLEYLDFSSAEPTFHFDKVWNLSIYSNHLITLEVSTTFLELSLCLGKFLNIVGNFCLLMPSIFHMLGNNVILNELIHLCHLIPIKHVNFDESYISSIDTLTHVPSP